MSLSLSLSCLLLGPVVATVTGCGGGTTEGEDDEGGETGPPPNEYNCGCLEGMENYQCFCYQGTNWQLRTSSYDAGSYCASAQFQAQTMCHNYCQSQLFTPKGHAPDESLPCEDQEPTPNCTGWDPPSEVFYHTLTDTYYLDWAFAWEVWGDSTPLVGCDDATILLTENGFQVGDANSGELLYELGLRNGDIMISINGIDLDDFSDANYAFLELFLNEHETDYTLEVERNSNLIELNYNFAVSQ